MTKIRAALSGTHSLSEELIRKILDYKYGRDSITPVKELFHKESAELVLLQESANFPVVSSGFLGLEDLIRPFTRSLDSFKSYHDLGDLPIIRWHYTNTFYRQPTLVDKFPEDSRIILDDKHSLSGGSAYSHEAVKGNTSRIVVPGPFSLVSLVNRGDQEDIKSLYPDLNALIEASGQFLAQELAKLPSNYVEIQFDEPALVWKNFSRQLRPSIKQAYEHIQSAVGNKKTIVNTYFENVMPVLKFLLDLPADGIGIDLIATNLVHLTTTSFEGKILQAGIINAENYVPTPTGDLNQSQTDFFAHLAESLVKLHPTELIVTTNTGLEYLPKPIADSCLQLLGNIVKEVEN